MHTNTTTPQTTTATTDKAATPHRRLAGLDGLRGAAVAAVVVYHAFGDVLPAGFLGVSLFFALSGFLITRLMLAENDRTGRIDLAGFWGRRMRRLMPAALAALTAIGAVWMFAGWASTSLPGELVASLLYGANWQFLWSATEYGGADPSPLTHFWSLAIEEQFYLVLPFAGWAALRSRGNVATFAAVLAAAFAASVLYVVAHLGDTMTVYFSTFSRSAEILAGALAAIAVHYWPRLVDSGIVRVAGTVAGIGIVAAAATTSLHGGLYANGGLIASGVASALVCVAACGVAGGPLCIAPLRFLGTISYALYLIHWPVLVGLDIAGYDTAAVTVAALAATVLAAWASTVFFETPIRERRLPTTAMASGAGMSFAAIVVVAGIVASTTEPLVADFEQAAAAFEERATAPMPDRANTLASPAPTTTPAPESTTTSVAPAPEPVSVMMFGDSTALMLAFGTEAVPDRIVDLGGSVKLGCPITRADKRRGAAGSNDGESADARECRWDQEWIPRVQERGSVDVALISAGIWDTAAVRIPEPGGRWTTLDDPAFVDHLRSEMLAVSDALVDSGVGTVAWTTLASSPQQGTERFERRRLLVNDLIREVAAMRPDTVTVIDLATYFDTPGREAVRPDGIHVTRESGAAVWTDWLADQVITAAHD